MYTLWDCRLRARNYSRRFQVLLHRRVTKCESHIADFEALGAPWQYGLSLEGAGRGKGN